MCVCVCAYHIDIQADGKYINTQLVRVEYFKYLVLCNMTGGWPTHLIILSEKLKTHLCK